MSTYDMPESWYAFFFLDEEEYGNDLLFVGMCNETSNTTFACVCASGWEGVHCETQINFCQTSTCQNNGVCRPLLLNYTCECLGESYSGRHCEIKSNTVVVRGIISRSFAYVVIVAMMMVAMFIIVLDVLKYGFNIDPAHEEKKKTRKRKAPSIVRYVYVHTPTVPKLQSTKEETVHTVQETKV